MGSSQRPATLQVGLLSVILRCQWTGKIKRIRRSISNQPNVTKTVKVGLQLFSFHSPPARSEHSAAYHNSDEQSRKANFELFDHLHIVQLFESTLPKMKIILFRLNCRWFYTPSNLRLVLITGSKGSRSSNVAGSKPNNLHYTSYVLADSHSLNLSLSA